MKKTIKSIIKIAGKNGYKYRDMNPDVFMERREYLSKDFAKAFFSKIKIWIPEHEIYHKFKSYRKGHWRTSRISWQTYLKELVLADDPIVYFEAVLASEKDKE